MRAIWGGVVSLTVTVVEQVAGSVCPFDADTTTTFVPNANSVVNVRLDSVSVPDGISLVWYGVPFTVQMTSTSALPGAISTLALTVPTAVMFALSRVNGSEQLTL